MHQLEHASLLPFPEQVLPLPNSLGIASHWQSVRRR
jgi:hypothetical protein